MIFFHQIIFLLLDKNFIARWYLFYVQVDFSITSFHPIIFPLQYNIFLSNIIKNIVKNMQIWWITTTTKIQQCSVSILRVLLHYLRLITFFLCHPPASTISETNSRSRGKNKTQTPSSHGTCHPHVVYFFTWYLTA